jgi:thiamine biosynthesis lipoprotein
MPTIRFVDFGPARPRGSGRRAAPRRWIAIAWLSAWVIGGFAALHGMGDGGAHASPETAGPRADSSPRRTVTYRGRSMGTYVHVTLVTTDSVATAQQAQAALAAFARVDSLMSNWTTTSEVARLNREAGTQTTVVHPEVATVLEAALAAWRASDGAFDITVEPLVRLWGFLGGAKRVPSAAEAETALRRVGSRHLDFDASTRVLRFAREDVRIDLGGIAKGYAVDAAVRALKTMNVHDALVDISGNMYAVGRPPRREEWSIGIRDPRDRVPYFGRLRLLEQGISTSGKYEQFVAGDGRTYGHIIDPRSGRTADGLIAVTVLAPTAMEADAWSTALFVLGPAEARRKARERDDVAALLVSPGEGGRDTLWVEGGLAQRLTIEESARRLFHVLTF